MAEIRRTSLENFSQLRSLMYQYIVGFYKRPAPPEHRVDALMMMLLEGKHGVQFVAVEDHALVGFATLYFTYTTTRADKSAVMNDIFVLEEFRGNGVGRQLFDHCLDYVRSHGYTHMSWVTEPDNQAAQRFYAKVGGILGNWLPYSIE